MKLRRVSNKDYKSETIKVHLSRRERDRLEAYASRLGMNISQYIRTKCIYEPHERLESSTNMLSEPYERLEREW